jgi:hypothetical protein
VKSTPSAASSDGPCGASIQDGSARWVALGLVPGAGRRGGGGRRGRPAPGRHFAMTASAATTPTATDARRCRGAERCWFMAMVSESRALIRRGPRGDRPLGGRIVTHPRLSADQDERPRGPSSSVQRFDAAALDVLHT